MHPHPAQISVTSGTLIFLMLKVEAGLKYLLDALTYTSVKDSVGFDCLSNTFS